MSRRLKVFFIVLVAVCIAAMGVSSADPSIPAKDETQGLTIGTIVSVTGSLKEDNEVVWETSTGILNGTLDLLQPSIPVDDLVPGGIFIPGFPDDPIFDIFKSPGEVQYTTVYTEDTSAIDGHVGYTNQFALDTGNQARGESNIEVMRGIVFTTDTSGSLSSSENLILDGAGQFNFADDMSICPFAASDEFIPAFCNNVEMGSDVLISSGSLATQATERFVSTSSDVPVTMDYLIQLSGTNGPAEGSVAAHMNVLAREGAVTVLYDIPNPPDIGGEFMLVRSDLVSELKFDETTSVSGQITLFEKIMHYESGMFL